MPVTLAALAPERVGDRARHRAHRRLVEHQRDPGTARSTALRVAQVAAHDLEAAVAAREARGSPRLPGREVVEDPHAVAVGEQTLDEVRADEAGAAGDEGEGWGRHEWRASNAPNYGGRRADAVNFGPGGGAASAGARLRRVDNPGARR